MAWLSVYPKLLSRCIMVKAMKPPSKKNKILIMIIIVGILVILSLNFFQKEVKGFFYTISSPAQKTLRQASDDVADFWGGIFNSKNLKKENEGFKLTIQELLADNTFLQELEKENQALRDVLEIGLQKKFRLTLAEVISKDIGQASILINQGAKDGLGQGMPVITEQKVLLGRITEVFADFSRVSLISDKESSFDVEIPDRDASGVAKGKGGENLDLDFISQDKEVREGDLVVSASLGGIYPKGLLVGLVQEIKRSDIKPFYQIKVAPFFDLKETGDVLIILDF